MALKGFPGLPGINHISPISTDANIKKMVNVEDPEEFNDTANKGYVDAQIAGVSSLWEVSGSNAQLITARPVDMQTKKILNVVDPTSDQEAATKKYVDDNAGGLWEVDGSESQLIVARDIDMRSKDFINRATRMNIHPAAFQPQDPTITWTLDHTELLNSNGDNQIFVASLDLPEGSTLASAIAYGSLSTDLWWIYKLDSSGSVTLLGNEQMGNSDTISEVIDNDTYSYVCQVRLATTKKLFGLKLTIT